VEQLRISTPGRVCLFGEHQDYLHLPVIPCAISLRIGITGTRRSDPVLSITLPDIRKKDEMRIDGECRYVRERDYVRSVVNVLRRRGFTFTGGFDCTVGGSIPINAGTSSSSALVVSWVNFLARNSDQRTVLPPQEIGKLAYAAEVLEFGEPGGMMDQYSTALGGVLWIGFHPDVQIEPLFPKLGTFVLGDSRQPKDTKSILSRVKNGVLKILADLNTTMPGFSIHTADRKQAESAGCRLSENDLKLLLGTIQNRDLTVEAKTLLSEPRLDERRLGVLLNEHQAVLREVLGISTPKIDRMISAALDAGAYGGKINGSGGGGCMFVYAPEHPEKIAAAIERAGGKAYIVSVDRGTTAEE
jgi:galactokinase